MHSFFPEPDWMEAGTLTLIVQFLRSQTRLNAIVCKPATEGSSKGSRIERTKNLPCRICTMLEINGAGEAVGRTEQLKHSESFQLVVESTPAYVQAGGCFHFVPVHR